MARTERLSVRATPEQAEQIRRMAATHGTSVSQVIIDRLEVAHDNLTIVRDHDAAVHTAKQLLRWGKDPAAAVAVLEVSLAVTP